MSQLYSLCIGVGVDLLLYLLKKQNKKNSNYMPHNQKLLLVMINSSYKISFLKGGSVFQANIFARPVQSTLHTISWHLVGVASLVCPASAV